MLQVRKRPQNKKEIAKKEEDVITIDSNALTVHERKLKVSKWWIVLKKTKILVFIGIDFDLNLFYKIDTQAPMHLPSLCFPVKMR